MLDDLIAYVLLLRAGVAPQEAVERITQAHQEASLPAGSTEP